MTVTDPAGKPMAGAILFSWMARVETQANRGSNPPLEYDDIATTGADGVAEVPYEILAEHPLAARDPARKLIGFSAESPASLRHGAITLRLYPQCLLRGTLMCDELTKAAKPLDRTKVTLNYKDLQLLGFYSSYSNDFEFPVPPGDYMLYVFGTNVSHKYVSVTVRAGNTELRVPPIHLTPSNLVALQGHPAPELAGVVGWKGQPVKLTDLKGKYVLIDFWGYWCHPCVLAMPDLMELHERFKGKGLAIIGVHADWVGEVDTAAKLDEKITAIKKTLWHGKDLPFPVALISGKSIDDGEGRQTYGGAAAQYGIIAYPTTILIDRQGNLVGTFDATVASVEKLLSTPN